MPLTTVALSIVIAPAAVSVIDISLIVTVPTFAVTVSESAVSPSATVNSPDEAPMVVPAFAAPVMDQVTPATAVESLYAVRVIELEPFSMDVGTFPVPSFMVTVGSETVISFVPGL